MSHILETLNTEQAECILNFIKSARIIETEEFNGNKYVSVPSVQLTLENLMKELEGFIYG